MSPLFFALLVLGTGPVLAFYTVPLKKNLLRDTNHVHRFLQSKTLPLNNRDVIYTLDVGIGTPPQIRSLWVDTGSADTWVVGPECLDGCSTSILFDPDQSSTYQILQPPTQFNIDYTGGASASVDVIEETLTFDDITLRNITMGLAFESTAGNGTQDLYDGFLGMAFPDLALFTSPIPHDACG